MTKNLNLEELPKIIKKFKNKGKKIVQCHGVFDLLHLGHIKHFENAKQSKAIPKLIVQFCVF